MNTGDDGGGTHRGASPSTSPSEDAARQPPFQGSTLVGDAPTGGTHVQRSSSRTGQAAARSHRSRSRGARNRHTRAEGRLTSHAAPPLRVSTRRLQIFSYVLAELSSAITLLPDYTRAIFNFSRRVVGAWQAVTAAAVARTRYEQALVWVVHDQRVRVLKRGFHVSSFAGMGTPRSSRGAAASGTTRAPHSRRRRSEGKSHDASDIFAGGPAPRTPSSASAAAALFDATTAAAATSASLKSRRRSRDGAPAGRGEAWNCAKSEEEKLKDEEVLRLGCFRPPPSTQTRKKPDAHDEATPSPPTFRQPPSVTIEGRSHSRASVAPECVPPLPLRTLRRLWLEAQEAEDKVGHYVDHLRGLVVDALFQHYLMVTVEGSYNDLALHPWLTSILTPVHRDGGAGILSAAAGPPPHPSQAKKSHRHSSSSSKKDKSRTSPPSPSPSGAAAAAASGDFRKTSSDSRLLSSPALHHVLADLQLLCGLMRRTRRTLDTGRRAIGGASAKRTSSRDSVGDGDDGKGGVSPPLKRLRSLSHSLSPCIMPTACVPGDPCPASLLNEETDLNEKAAYAVDEGAPAFPENSKGICNGPTQAHHSAPANAHEAGEGNKATKRTQASASSSSTCESRRESAPIKGCENFEDSTVAMPLPLRSFLHACVSLDPTHSALSLMSRCVLLARNVRSEDGEEGCGPQAFAQSRWTPTADAELGNPANRNGADSREGPGRVERYRHVSATSAAEFAADRDSRAGSEQENVPSYDGLFYVVIARRAVGVCEHTSLCFGNHKFIFVRCSDTEALLREALSGSESDDEFDVKEAATDEHRGAKSAAADTFWTGAAQHGWYRQPSNFPSSRSTSPSMALHRGGAMSEDDEAAVSGSNTPSSTSAHSSTRRQNASCAQERGSASPLSIPAEGVKPCSIGHGEGPQPKAVDVHRQMHDATGSSDGGGRELGLSRGIGDDVAADLATSPRPPMPAYPLPHPPDRHIGASLCGAASTVSLFGTPCATKVSTSSSALPSVPLAPALTDRHAGTNVDGRGSSRRVSMQNSSSSQDFRRQAAGPHRGARRHAVPSHGKGPRVGDFCTPAVALTSHQSFLLGPSMSAPPPPRLQSELPRHSVNAGPCARDDADGNVRERGTDVEEQSDAFLIQDDGSKSSSSSSSTRSIFYVVMYSALCSCAPARDTGYFGRGTGTTTATAAASSDRPATASASSVAPTSVTVQYPARNAVRNVSDPQNVQGPSISPIGSGGGGGVEAGEMTWCKERAASTSGRLFPGMVPPLPRCIGGAVGRHFSSGNSGAVLGTRVAPFASRSMQRNASIAAPVPPTTTETTSTSCKPATVPKPPAAAGVSPEAPSRSGEGASSAHAASPSATGSSLEPSDGDMAFATELYARLQFWSLRGQDRRVYLDLSWTRETARAAGDAIAEEANGQHRGQDHRTEVSGSGETAEVGCAADIRTASHPQRSPVPGKHGDGIQQVDGVAATVESLRTKMATATPAPASAESKVVSADLLFPASSAQFSEAAAIADSAPCANKASAMSKTGNEQRRSAAPRCTTPSSPLLSSSCGIGSSSDDGGTSASSDTASANGHAGRKVQLPLRLLHCTVGTIKFAEEATMMKSMARRRKRQRLAPTSNERGDAEEKRDGVAADSEEETGTSLDEEEEEEEVVLPSLSFGSTTDVRGREMLLEAVHQATAVVVCGVRESRSHMGYHDMLHQRWTPPVPPSTGAAATAVQNKESAEDDSGGRGAPLEKDSKWVANIHRWMAAAAAQNRTFAVGTGTLSRDERNPFAFDTHRLLGVRGTVQWSQGDLSLESDQENWEVGVGGRMGVAGISAGVAAGARAKTTLDPLSASATRDNMSGNEAESPSHTSGPKWRWPVLPDHDRKQWRCELLKSEFRLARSRRLDCLLVDEMNGRPVAALTLSPHSWPPRASGFPVEATHGREGGFLDEEIPVENGSKRRRAARGAPVLSPQEVVQRTVYEVVEFTHYISPLWRHLREEKAVLVDMDRTLIDNAIKMHTAAERLRHLRHLRRAMAAAEGLPDTPNPCVLWRPRLTTVSTSRFSAAPFHLGFNDAAQLAEEELEEFLADQGGGTLPRTGLKSSAHLAGHHHPEPPSQLSPAAMNSPTSLDQEENDDGSRGRGGLLTHFLCRTRSQRQALGTLHYEECGAVQFAIGDFPSSTSTCSPTSADGPFGTATGASSAGDGAVPTAPPSLPTSTVDDRDGAPSSCPPPSSTAEGDPRARSFSDVVYVRPGIRQFLYSIATQWGIPIVLVTKSTRSRTEAVLQHVLDPHGVLFSDTRSCVVTANEMLEWSDSMDPNGGDFALYSDQCGALVRFPASMSSAERVARYRKSAWLTVHRALDADVIEVARRTWRRAAWCDVLGRLPKPRSVAVLDDAPQVWRECDWRCTLHVAPYTLTRIDPLPYFSSRGYATSLVLSCLFGSKCLVCSEGLQRPPGNDGQQREQTRLPATTPRPSTSTPQRAAGEPHAKEASCWPHCMCACPPDHLHEMEQAEDDRRGGCYDGDSAAAAAADFTARVSAMLTALLWYASRESAHNVKEEDRLLMPAAPPPGSTMAPSMRDVPSSSSSCSDDREDVKSFSSNHDHGNGNFQQTQLRRHRYHRQHRRHDRHCSYERALASTARPSDSGETFLDDDRGQRRTTQPSSTAAERDVGGGQQHRALLRHDGRDAGRTSRYLPPTPLQVGCLANSAASASASTTSSSDRNRGSSTPSTESPSSSSLSSALELWQPDAAAQTCSPYMLGSAGCAATRSTPPTPTAFLAFRDASVTSNALFSSSQLEAPGRASDEPGIGAGAAETIRGTVDETWTPMGLSDADRGGGASETYAVATRPGMTRRSSLSDVEDVVPLEVVPSPPPMASPSWTGPTRFHTNTSAFPDIEGGDASTAPGSPRSDWRDATVSFADVTSAAAPAGLLSDLHGPRSAAGAAPMVLNAASRSPSAFAAADAAATAGAPSFLEANGRETYVEENYAARPPSLPPVEVVEAELERPRQSSYNCSDEDVEDVVPL